MHVLITGGTGFVGSRGGGGDPGPATTYDFWSRRPVPTATVSRQRT